MWINARARTVTGPAGALASAEPPAKPGLAKAGRPLVSRPVGRLQGQVDPSSVAVSLRRMEVIDVERLVVWALRDQRAGEIVDGPVGLEAAEAAAAGAPRRRVSTCGCAAVERVLELGADIRVVGRGGAPTPGCSGDAEAVWAAVVGLAGERSRLVREHGRLGSRPDWVPRGARRGPVWERGAVPVVRYDGNRHKIAPWCALGWAVPREYVEARRASWGVWREGLAMLRRTLDRGGGLRGFVVLGPAVPARPWERTMNLIS